MNKRINMVAAVVSESWRLPCIVGLQKQLKVTRKDFILNSQPETNFVATNCE